MFLVNPFMRLDRTKKVSQFIDFQYKYYMFSFQPGANVPEDKCKNCVCGDSVDAQSHLHIIECHPTECDTHCQQVSDLH